MIRRVLHSLMVSLMVGATALTACVAPPNSTPESAVLVAETTPEMPTPEPVIVVETTPEPPTPEAPQVTATPTLPSSAQATPLHLGWVWPDDGPGLIPMVTVGNGGVLYVADRDGALYAVNAPGEVLWSVSGDCGEALPPVLSTDGSRLYLVGVGDTIQVCARDVNGALVWQTPVEGLTQSVPVLAPDGALHLRTESGVVRVSPDGTASEYALPEAVMSSLFGAGGAPVIDGSGNVYLAQDMADKVWVFSPDYEVSAECEVEGISSNVAAGSGAGFVVAAEPGQIVSYDPSCQKRWGYTALDEEWDDAWLVLAVGQDDVLYAGGPGGLLLALSADGAELWRNEPQTDGPELLSLAIGVDGTIAAAANRPASVLAYTGQGEPLLTQELYKIEDTGMPSALPDGSIAQVHEGRLKVYLSDPTLVVVAPTPAPPPQSAAEAEAEIVQFMVAMIAEEEIEGTLRYIEETDWYSTGPTENLIVWSDVLDPEASEAMTETSSFLEGIPALDDDNPRRVWTYGDGQLVEVTGDTAQKLAAIDAYQADFMDMETEQSIFAWGLYEFAVVSLDRGLQKAEVYRSISCGPLCGSGYLLTLERAPDGEWYVSDSVHLWQS